MSDLDQATHAGLSSSGSTIGLERSSLLTGLDRQFPSTDSRQCSSAYTYTPTGLEIHWAVGVVLILASDPADMHQYGVIVIIDFFVPHRLIELPLVKTLSGFSMKCGSRH